MKMLMYEWLRAAKLLTLAAVLFVSGAVMMGSAQATDELTLELELFVGESVRPKMIIGEGDYITKSSDEDVAYVDEAGNIIGENVGFAVVDWTEAEGFGVHFMVTVRFFDDVQPSDWHYESVKFAYTKGMFGGTSAATFSPRLHMTRAMMVQALYNLAGSPPVTNTTGFKDAASSDWHGNAVAWAVSNQIASGTSKDTFSPKLPMTREQMAIMFYNYTKAMDVALPATRMAVKFVDSDKISSWAVEAVTAMSGAGVLNGKDGQRFDPQGLATRAEVAAMFANFYMAVEQ